MLSKEPRSHSKRIEAPVGGEGGGCTQPMRLVLKDRHPVCVCVLPGRLQLQLVHDSNAPHKCLLRCFSCFPATWAHILIVPTHFTQIKLDSPVWTFSKASSLLCFGTEQYIRGLKTLLPKGTKYPVTSPQAAQHYLDVPGTWQPSSMASSPFLPYGGGKQIFSTRN